MATPNKPPKIEVRSRTGASYSRAGVRWQTGWTEVPAEILKDKKKVQQLRDDPYLEVRVDGQRVSKTGQPIANDPEQATDESAAFAALKAEHKNLLDAYRKDGEAHDAEIAALKARVFELESAAKSAAEATAKSSAPAAKTETATNAEPKPAQPTVTQTTTGSASSGAAK